MAEEKMSPAEFKAECKRRGWTNRALAARWRRSEAWISKIGSDPDRDQYWDDAVRGLPIVKKSKTHA
jgi:hypothetical protein